MAQEGEEMTLNEALAIFGLQKGDQRKADLIKRTRRKLVSTEFHGKLHYVTLCPVDGLSPRPES